MGLIKSELRAKSPHLVKLTGVDPLGVVLPLKIVSLFLSPFRVVGVDSNASLFSSWESLATFPLGLVPNYLQEIVGAWEIRTPISSTYDDQSFMI